MSTSTACVPPGEPYLDLLSERLDIATLIVISFLYGINFTLYLACVDLLWHQRQKRARETWFYIGYVTLMLIWGTLYLVAIGNITQDAYVDDRNFPGGPLAYESFDFLNPVFYMGAVIYYVANWFADGLLLWRCMIIWKGSPFRPILIFPCLLYLCSFILSIFSMIATRAPNGTVAGFDLLLPYFVISLAVNMVISALIVTRLLMQRKLVHDAIGAQHSAQYVSIAAMIIESAALYAIVSIWFLVPYIIGHPLANIVLDMLGEVQIMAPLLIIYRVARGRAWDSRTSAAILQSRAMTFATPGETSIESSEATARSLSIYPAATAIQTGVMKTSETDMSKPDQESVY